VIELLPCQEAFEDLAMYALLKRMGSQVEIKIYMLRFTQCKEGSMHAALQLHLRCMGLARQKPSVDRVLDGIGLLYVLRSWNNVVEAT
jgi:hypothetical protein